MDGGIVPISAARHAARFWRRFTSFAFARTRRMVPVVLDEVEAVAAAMPLAFARLPAEGQSAGALLPVALLDLSDGGETPFVTPGGQWRGTYVPGALRVHPFAAAPGAERRLVLLVDESTGHVTDDPGDEPFFADATGTPAPALDGVIEFLRAQHASALATRAACDALRDCPGLIVPLALPEAAGDLTGLCMADPARLAALDGDALTRLHRLGALRLAHAQRVSMANAGWLARAGQVDTRAAATTQPVDDTGLGGFLDAVARAQVADAAYTTGGRS